MTDKFKTHRKAGHKANAGYGKKLAREVAQGQAKADSGLSNRHGGGRLPPPSQLGWGQHKSKKTGVSLFDPWRKS